MKVHWQFLLFFSFINAVLSDETVAAEPDTVEPPTTESPVDTEADALVKAQTSRDGLHTFLIENPNAKSCRASPYMQKFLETNKLQALPNLGLEDLQRYLRSVDPSVNLKHVEVIHPHYLRYIQFLKNLKSRNRLIQYLNSKSSYTNLELATRMDEFLRGHGLLTTSHNIAEAAFTELMLSKDNFISLTQIRKIYSVLPEYLKFIGITQAREKLLEKITSDPSAVMSKLRPEIDEFITAVEIARLTNPTLDQIKDHIRNKDALMYPEDVEKVAEIYKSYREFQERVAVRTDIISKSKATGTPGLTTNKLIHTTLADFMTKYELNAVDVFNSDIYQTHIRERDDDISNVDIATTQQYAKKYKLYDGRRVAYTKAKDFVGTQATIPQDKLQPYMSTLIDTFEIAGTNDINVFVSKINDYLGDTTATATADIHLFNAFRGFETFYLKKNTFTTLLEYIKTTDTTSTDASVQTTLTQHITTFLNKFTDLNDDVYYLNSFIKKITEFDSTISKEDITIVHPHVKKHKINDQKTTCRNELKIELAKLDTDPTKTEPNKNIKIDTFIAVYGLTDDDMTTKDKFVAKMKEVDETATTENDANLYESVKTRMESTEFIAKISDIIKVPQPGEFGDDGEVIPPTGGSKRFWYDFFKFFGAKPHKVEGVASYDDLFVFKRWFNAIYKWLTDIDFYILVDAKPQTEVVAETEDQAEEEKNPTEGGVPEPT